MRKLRLIAIVSVVCLCACDRYSRSTSGISALEKQVLYDFRRISKVQGGPRDDPKVLAALFPSHLRDARECGQGKALPQIAPWLESSVHGSFTAPGARETAYLVNVGECGRDAPTHRLAIFRGEKPILDLEVMGANEVLDVYDLNGDGTSELLLGGRTSGKGRLLVNAWLVQLDKRALRTIEDFGQVYEDGCAAGPPANAITGLLVFYLPAPGGQMPRFTAEVYRAPCPSPGQAPQWGRAVGK